MKFILHVGLGKAASSLFTRHLFPTISQYRSFECLDQNNIQKLINDYNNLPDFKTYNNKLLAQSEHTEVQ